MITSIGFTNFRKFKNFPDLPFAPITILVGGNNAGKSSLVKALLMVNDFKRCLRFGDNNELLFHFDMASCRINSFGRAKCNKSQSNTLSFAWIEDEVRYEVEMTGNTDKEDVTYARVDSFTMKELAKNFQFTFDFSKKQVHVKFNKTPLEGYERGRYFDSINSDISLDIPLNESEMSSPWFGDDLAFRTLVNYVLAILTTISGNERIFQYYDLVDVSSIQGTLSEEDKKFLRDNEREFRHILKPEFLSFNLEYVYAHSATQNVLYSARDEGDYITRTIHAFASPKVQGNPKVKPFIQEWMKNFEIGVDYKLDTIAGEAHTVRIMDQDGYSVNLADKGMGSVQLMILLFRVAICFSEYDQHTVFVLEEPELNLHPKTQSLLAKFFFEVYGEYKCRFLIETHSEYLIRKTQVLVKENHLAEEGKKNPFKVYYFGGDNADGKPYYQMRYRPDGIFENEFGKGFFDEAANLAIKIL